MEFAKWPSIPRLDGETMVVTEKIDGTNGAVVVCDDGRVLAQSRNGFVTPEKDNHGFAAWVYEYADVLRMELGPGRHFGEWWGWKIQRGYDLTERRFSLFDTRRAMEAFDTPGLNVVPVLYYGPACLADAQFRAAELYRSGSVAAPGFAKPEGVVVRLERSGAKYKVNDSVGPKSLITGGRQ